MPSPLLLAAALVAGPGAVAHVDDSNSHGAVGDAHLSLDEAIRLANGSLALGSLSAAEQARIVGTGPVLTIRIDAAVTPTITAQAPLTGLAGQGPATGMVLVEGVPANGNRPVIDGNTQPTVLSLVAHTVRVMMLAFHGGGVAVDADLPAFPAGASMPMLMHCSFDGQTACGVQVQAHGAGESVLMMRNLTFTNMPLGVNLIDQTQGGRAMADIEHTSFDGVTTGVHAAVDGSGTDTMVALWRSTFTNGATLASSTRGVGSSKLFMLRFVYVDATCSGDVIDCQGNVAGVTMVHHHHSDWTAGPGKHAFYVHPRTATFDLHGSEMVFRGDVVFAGNTGSPRFWHQNNRYENCTITFDVDGALPNLLWNHYDGCTIQVPFSARSPVDLRNSELVNTDVDCQSFLAPVELDGCHRIGGTLTGFATETNPAPAPFLGATDVTPRFPAVGTAVTLSADLPAGVAMIWDLASSDPRPYTSAEPVRLYGIPYTLVPLPVLVIYQSTLTVPIPNQPTLIGEEFYWQGISLPLNGQPWIPAYHLPRGGRTLLQ
ncbi:MAG TPA: hypothetical protein ENI87_04650 [bacterium]|nr:hypothetical protein [bacterium]